MENTIFEFEGKRYRRGETIEKGYRTTKDEIDRPYFGSCGLYRANSGLFARECHWAVEVPPDGPGYRIVAWREPKCGEDFLTSMGHTGRLLTINGSCKRYIIEPIKAEPEACITLYTSRAAYDRRHTPEPPARSIDDWFYQDRLAAIRALNRVPTPNTKPQRPVRDTSTQADAILDAQRRAHKRYAADLAESQRMHPMRVKAAIYQKKYMGSTR